MSTYSPILRTELIGDGQQPGAWGATTNSNFQYVFESAIAGYQAVTVSPTSNNQVLTYVNGPSSTASLTQSIFAILKLVPGTVGAAYSIFAPPVSKSYIIWNNTSYTATFYNSTIIGNTTPAGTGIAIPAGAKVTIWTDGTSFYGNDTVVGALTIAGNLSIGGTLSVTGAATFSSSIAALSATFTNPLPVLSGGTGATTATGTGSAVLAASPALTGVPTAPTATAGDNSTQIATTAFVQAKVGTLGTMASQNANAVNITGGTIGTATNAGSIGTNAYGNRTVSTSAPSGGSDGDIWYKV